MRHSIRLLVLLLLAATSEASAQIPQYPDAVRDAVRRVFASRDFAPQRFGPARFIQGGAAYTTLERAAEGSGVDIVKYESATGARSVLVAAKAMTPAGATAPLAFDDYIWSDDGAKLLLFTNTERVWRSNTRGDYWVLTLATGQLQKLGGDAPVSSLMYAKFSPDGGRVAYVSQGDIYVQKLSDASIVRLTTGADSLHVNGMSDWVYEEEFSLRDGFRWSPDGARIAYWHFDMAGVRTFTLINNTDSLYPFTIPIQYPKAGQPNSAVTVGVVSASGGATTWIKTEGDPRDNYIPWMEWAGPNDVMIQRLNRLQNTDDVLMADPATGVTRTLLSERDSAWVDLIDDVPWIDGGRRFLWTSEKDGWRHVYAVSRDGKTQKLITPGAFDVVSVAGIDSAAGMLYYIASPENATQRYLYRTKLDGTGRATRVSPAAQVGTHRYTMARGGKWAFHTFSSFDRVPTTDLVRLPDHSTVRTLVQNDRLREAVAPFLTRPVEFFKAPVAGGVTVDGWMIKPRDFDSTKTYPMLVYVYGEPAGQTTNDSWSGGSALWYRTIADAGYIVVSIDNSGTPAPRGRAWRKIIYGAVGVLSSQQQAEAVQYLARDRHYVDSTRVAIWGWSGGGSSTLQAMFRYPKVYQVGISVASVPDQRLYDNIYQERYMGLPTTNANGYRDASPISHAAGLEGHLLLVHGTGDDNVHFQGAQRLINELVRLRKPFEFMEYPNRSHCICEGQGTTEHVYQLITRYLMEHLPAGGR